MLRDEILFVTLQLLSECVLNDASHTFELALQTPQLLVAAGDRLLQEESAMNRKVLDHLPGWTDALGRDHLFPV